MSNYDTWTGQTAYDSDDKKVGTIEDLYLDDDTNVPKWATIKSSSLFGSKLHFAPVAYSDEIEDGIRFNVSQDAIKNAPSLDADTELSDEDQALLYQHYALDDNEEERQVDGDETSDSVVRSEEQLHISKETHQTGVARLKKYIVTEQVHTTVPVQKEVVRLEREPITDEDRDSLVGAPELSEEEHEMTLSEERVVVSKETVPVERVKMTKDIVADQVEVNDSVQKEQVDIDEG